jgi:hypothetical protein
MFTPSWMSSVTMRIPNLIRYMYLIVTNQPDHFFVLCTADKIVSAEILQVIVYLETNQEQKMACVSYTWSDKQKIEVLDSLCQTHFSTAWHVFNDGKHWQKYLKPLTLQIAYNNNIIENYCAWPTDLKCCSLYKNTVQTGHAYINVSFSLRSGHSNYSAKPVGVPGAQQKSRLQYSKQADDPWQLHPMLVQCAQLFLCYRYFVKKNLSKEILAA